VSRNQVWVPMSEQNVSAAPDMTNAPTWHGSGIGDALFSSTQQRVLALLFGQPHRSFYTNEIIALVGAGTGAVQRELSKLSKSGLVEVERVGNQKHYRANPHSPIFGELRSLVEKTFGLAAVLSLALEQLCAHLCPSVPTPAHPLPAFNLARNV